MKFFTYLFLLLGFTLSAQDDLLDLIDEGPQTEYAYATFKGTRIINLQSNELPAKGVMQFMIMHRFGAINDEFLYNFFGLDVAQIRLSLDYSFTDWLNVGIGRSSFSKTYDGFAKIRLLRQSKGAKNMPFGLVWYFTINYTTLKWDDNLPHNESDRLSYTHELIMVRKFSKNFSLELVPSLVHFNLVEDQKTPNDIFVLGIGGRYKITNRVAFTAEYGLQLTDNFYYDTDGNKTNYENALSIGVDIETGGHVFQIHATNSRGLADPQWMARTPGSWGNGDIFLGFNISRVFTVKKPKLPEE
jgi:hypothetical protein